MTVVFLVGLFGVLSAGKKKSSLQLILGFGWIWESGGRRVVGVIEYEWQAEEMILPWNISKPIKALIIK